MSRDHRKLHAFVAAGALIPDVYRCTSGFPIEERFGLQAQIRRAAVSIATNIVEGSARSTSREYCRFLEVAFASARETAYLLTVARRLAFLPDGAATKLATEYDEVAAMLHNAVRALESADR